MASGWSSGARWAAGPQATVSSALMCAAHHAAIASSIIKVGEESKVSRSLGMPGLSASQAS